ncbi:MAG: pyruvate kinase [Eubacterium sp.]|nr:pyruvate kinase [Eubacterium sp.]
MTEIFGTLGPACAQADQIEKMFAEGMTGMRLNLSHGGLKESEPLIRSFHQAAQRAGIRPELLIDMQGPEIRIGDLPVPLQLKEGREAVLAAFVSDRKAQAAEPGTYVIPVAEHILSVLEEGSHVLLDDGKLELVVTDAKQKDSVQRVLTSVLRGGVLYQRKSLKVAGRQIPAPVMTVQDRENIRLAREYGVTALMQPFVTEGAQLSEVRQELLENGMGQLRLFAKIENCAGIEHMKDIMPFADMIVIARGDLGNDMPLWKLPAAQKYLSDLCKDHGKPFLVVTQLLASMTEHPYPTRAEVSDIFHAVTDGAAAVMVTNETAVGKYPVEVIRYLKKTVQEAEAWK